MAVMTAATALATTRSEEPGSFSPPTDAARAMKRLMDDIVSGALPPDCKLKMRELKDRYGFGASPLREALSQLAAQGLVEQESQRGFRVPPLSVAHIDDLTRSRQLIEAEALRLAIAHGGAQWEAEIAGSFHLLEREIRRLKARRLPLDDRYESVHHRFHRALISACPLPSLIKFSDLLYVQASRYRRLMMQALDASDVLLSEHAKLKDLTLARRPDAAVQALTRHIGIPARLIVSKLAAETDTPPRPTKAAAAVQIKRTPHRRRKL